MSGGGGGGGGRSCSAEGAVCAKAAWQEGASGPDCRDGAQRLTRERRQDAQSPEELPEGFTLQWGSHQGVLGRRVVTGPDFHLENVTLSAERSPVRAARN